MKKIFNQCPHCGDRSNKRVWEAPITDYKMRYSIHCIECDFDTGLCLTEDEAIKEWNRYDRSNKTTFPYRMYVAGFNVFGVMLVIIACISISTHQFKDLLAVFALVPIGLNVITLPFALYEMYQAIKNG